MLGCARGEAGDAELASDTIPGTPGLVAPRVAILPLDEARVALRPCTRRPPRGAGDAWVPTSAVARRVDGELVPVLDSVLRRVHRAGGYPNARTSADYRRHYAGCRRGRRWYLYVSGTHDLSYRPFGRGDSSRTVGWEKRTIQACDGGTLYFGVEYDLHTRRFGGVEFNERVDGAVRY